jgi:methanogenic corrinoid protein MtbC1
LQHLLLDLSEAFQDGVAESVQGRRALLVAGPGEQHTLGLFMVAEFLRRAGWEVSGAAPSSRAGLIDAVRAERFDIAGLSAGCDCHLDRMAATIADIRRSSRNTEIAILVGGSAFANHPEAVARVGADAMAQDAREAVKVANRLVCVKERR